MLVPDRIVFAQCICQAKKREIEYMDSVIGLPPTPGVKIIGFTV